MHRRPRLILISAAVLAVAAVAAVLWWRARPLQVAAPPGAGDPACAQLADRLPRTVRDAGRVPTSSSSPAVAAWGEPAVVWRCGVTAPGPTTDECLDVDGVDWVAHPLDDGTSFTTYGRDPAVQVLVPHVGGSPDPLVLPPFSRAVVALPQGDRRCS
ncbi:hypothetical protein GCM10027446_33610 [Angustibacter peucedani]